MRKPWLALGRNATGEKKSITNLVRVMLCHCVDCNVESEYLDIICMNFMSGRFKIFFFTSVYNRFRITAGHVTISFAFDSKLVATSESFNELP